MQTTESRSQHTLRAFGQRLARGWGELLEWPPLRRLLPADRVMLVGEGGASTWRVPGFERDAQAATHPGGAAFVAVEVPEGNFLERRLDVPLGLDAEYESAMRLEVEAVSPFPADDTAWGWRPVTAASGMRGALIAITSRRLVEQRIEALAGRLPAQHAPEVWVLGSQGPVVLNGFGEVRRQSAHTRQMRRTGVLLALAVLVTCAVALTPVIEKRQQVVQALNHQGVLSGQAGPVVALRDELGAVRMLHDTLGPRIAAEPDLMALLDRVTMVVPDGGWLDLFEYNPGTIRIGGRADNAAALLQALQEQPGFTNVRAPSPIMREPQTNKERFVIEVDLAQ